VKEQKAPSSFAYAAVHYDRDSNRNVLGRVPELRFLRA